MHFVCKQCLWRHKCFPKFFIYQLRVIPLSTEVQPQSNPLGKYLAEVQAKIKTAEAQDKNEVSKYLKFEKLHTNKPFVKNLFLGKFDKAMLEFPELSNNEELNTLNSFVQVLDIVFKEKVDSNKIDKDGKITQATHDALRSLGLFGLQVPEEYGGLGLTATKYSRLSEVTARDSSVAVTLAAHQAFALAGLIQYGSEEQKSRYLPSLASGQQLAAFCLTESNSGSDVGGAEMTATPSVDGSVYHLNGRKTWVVNGAGAGVLIVFAKTPIVDEKGVSTEWLTGFIVERGHGGVKSSPSAPRFGVRGADICEITFENTPVPVENILGTIGSGFKIAMNILNSGRYTMGSRGCGLLKAIIDDCIAHVITRKQFGKALQNYKMIKDKLATLAVNAYAMESVAYLTTLTLDKYLEPDISVESAIVKVFASERLWACLDEVMNLFGASAYSTHLPYERHLRDSRVNLVYEGTNDILRLYIALTGLQYAGPELQESTKESRNPLDYPSSSFKHLIKNMLKRYQHPHLTLHLDEELHPALQLSAKALETNVLRFEYVIHEMLSRYGNSIVGEQTVLRRIADTAILLYVMTACLARASRSMCIGLPNHDDEVLMTNIFCHDADRQVYQLMMDLVNGPTKNMDDNRLLVADKMLKQHKCTPAHPLERNW